MVSCSAFCALVDGRFKLNCGVGSDGSLLNIGGSEYGWDERDENYRWRLKSAVFCGQAEARDGSLEGSKCGVVYVGHHMAKECICPWH